MVAKLIVTTGPDRGKMFDMTEELIHVGRGSENQIVLSDPALAEHQMSIVSRNGRYAIYTPMAEGIEVEGSPVPPQKWVWLPDEAAVQLTQRTSVKFVSGDAPHEGNGTGAATKNDASQELKGSPSASVAFGEKEVGSSTRTKQKTTKSGKKTTVARFITDGPGDPLVKLGEDGRLPELSLEEGEARRKRETESRQSNPLLLAGAIVLSFCLSALMLFVDFGNLGGGTVNKTTARREIAEYFGSDKDPLQPYQIALREAQQAYSRRDFEEERREYRKVLDMLRAEGKDKYKGLTGNDTRDERLEKLIAILLVE